MAKKKIKPKADPPTFEESLDELETIVGDLENGQLGLADSLARYEQGMRYLQVCHQQLEQAERKIELLSGTDADGNPITRPFDDEAGDSLQEKASARGRRRTSDIDDGQRLF